MYCQDLLSLGLRYERTVKFDYHRFHGISEDTGLQGLHGWFSPVASPRGSRTKGSKSEAAAR